MIKEIIIGINELVRKNMDVNGQWRLQHYTWMQIQVREQLVVRKNMDVNGQWRLQHYTQMKIQSSKGTACRKKEYG